MLKDNIFLLGISLDKNVLKKN